MGLVRVLLLGGVVLAACYQGPAASELACKLRCTDHCPDGLTCQNGVCVGPGGSCGPGGGDASTGSDAALAPQCIAQVGLGYHHSCVLKTDGTVWCVGNNAFGQLGNDATGGTALVPVQARDASGPITDAVAVAAGGNYDHATSCAIRTGGSVWCWGSGNDGALGNNTFTTTPHAVKVLDSGTLAALTNVVEIGVGAYSACARDASLRVWCWGLGDNGRLGDGTYTTRSTAALVQNSSGQPFTGATKLSVGRSHACVIGAASSIWCWGINDTGRIGDGSYTDRARPVMVTTGTSVAAGRSHTCAAHADGTASCWGDSYHDRLGFPTSQDVPTPTTVLASLGGSPLQGVAAVATAGVSCALMTDGGVQCWGISTHGQTGTGAGSRVPMRVLDANGAPITNIDSIAAGTTHVCAHPKTGGMLCWGRNEDGELATGTTANIGLATPLALTCP